MAIDIRDVNNLGPSKFRTRAKNDKEQTCYFNYNKKESVINRFLAIRKKHHDNEILLSIVNLINKSNKFKDIYYNISDELENLTMTEFSLNKEFENLINQTIGDQHSTEVEKKKRKQWTNQQETKIFSK